jgi:rhamnosyltransferase
LKVSVIIPVKNGEGTLERCLAVLRTQTIADFLEIIILDSMSTDKSRKIALQFGATIIDIPEGTFNHGLTRNTGVQHATGDLLFYTVQDAFLSENDLLEKMVKHFDDPQVMGVAGHQAVPQEKDKNPLLWYKRYSEPQIEIREIKDVEEFKNSSQGMKQSLIAWDDVVAMYRKTALLQQPFAETQFAEDWIWSRDALMRGWRLIYDPSLVVYHYHHSTYRYAYTVAYAVNYHFYKYFNFKPQVPDLFTPLLKSIYHLAKNPQLKLKEKLYWISHNFLSKLGTFNSHVNFRVINFIGGFKSVEKRYNKVCRKIPQGKIKDG